MSKSGLLATSACALLLAMQAACAQSVLKVDASDTPASPTSGYVHMGTNTSASGDVLGMNNRYLTLDGKPWLPVMGEFDYARVPESDWQRTLLQMKSSGVDVVATYVYWNYHERAPGQFSWQGDLDLRHFVELCQQAGLYVILRIGPWVHAELRHGGFPDWVVRAMPTRRTDPTFMHYVGRFYRQIDKQVDDLLWKHDGPIIGIQMANEYHLHGRGQGRQYIAQLKKLTREAGLDVPLYMVTAWDDAVFPYHEVVPLFGGYPAKPWSTSRTRLAPSSVYAFRFDSRVSNGVLPTPQSHQQSEQMDADAVAAHTPFLSVEFGGGAPAMYRRRAVVAPDDIASMLPVGLGSGINMYGFYMFRGGRNHIYGTTTEENTRTGSYNDTPIISYDYQAPIGQYGQQHPVLDRIRPYLYFVQSFGSRLAPMVVREPDTVPASAKDLDTLRFSVRSLGDSGFIFVNNYARQYKMAAHPDTQFAVQLPDRTLHVPAQPVDIPSGAYFIWPFNFDMDGAHLRYATAQPVTRLQTAQGTVYVFMASDGIAPQFVFDQGTRVTDSSGRVARAGDTTRVDGIEPGLGAFIQLRGSDGQAVRVIVLDRKQAGHAWVKHDGKHGRLVITPDQAYFDGDTLKLQSVGDNHFRANIYPAPTSAPGASHPLSRMDSVAGFAQWTATAPKRSPSIKLTPLREALPVPPVRIGGTANAPVQPLPAIYGNAAAWTLEVSPDTDDDSPNAFIRIHYQGDVARLFSGATLLDDNYYNGKTWNIGLRHFGNQIRHPLTLDVLPLRGDSPIYIQSPYRPDIADDAQISHLLDVDIVPEYSLSVHFGDTGATSGNQ